MPKEWFHNNALHSPLRMVDGHRFYHVESNLQKTKPIGEKQRTYSCALQSYLNASVRHCPLCLRNRKLSEMKNACS